MVLLSLPYYDVRNLNKVEFLFVEIGGVDEGLRVLGVIDVFFVLVLEVPLLLEGYLSLEFVVDILIERLQVLGRGKEIEHYLLLHYF